MTIITRRTFGLGAATTVLAACSASPVPTDTYYSLTPPVTSSSRSGGPLKGIADVAPIRGDGVVNARALLFRGKQSQIQQYSYHFWADTPATMLQRSLVDALRAAQAFDMVATPDMRLTRDYEVMGTLRKLEHDLSQDGGRAVIEVELGVRKISGNKMLLLKVYTAGVAAPGGNMSGVVAACSAALGQILGQFIADLGQVQV
jgi:ABC-type uncharacterized transport system auxiliary subunit